MAEEKDTFRHSIAKAEARLKEIDAERDSLIKQLTKWKNALQETQAPAIIQSVPASSSIYPLDSRISLFRSLFRGREDIYPKLWVSKKTGAKGYSPVCGNEWSPGVCRKPAIKCGDCNNRKFSPISDDVVRKHLEGAITIGAYPMRADETCWFLAIDFDKESWQDDARAFMETSANFKIPGSLERSRSGNGGHVWIFFSEPIPAYIARQLGSFLITETMANRHELDMKSYDRLFPNQDTMPKGGFGNLIALPLQKDPRGKGNTVFLDKNLNPYSDQWNYMAGLKKMTRPEVEAFISEVTKSKDVIGLSMGQTDDEIKPWEKPLGRDQKFEKLICTLPPKLTVVLANRIYLKPNGLPSQFLNRVKRLAAFQNPEFYKKQSMRLSTVKTPRVICCAETIDGYLTIPRGCLDDLKELCSINDILLAVEDNRFEGEKISLSFHGELTEDQKKAVRKIMGSDQGIFVAPPGIGKTVIGINMIAARGVNTLVLVHRKPLLEQWRSQISSFLDIPINEVGQIGGGKEKLTNIVDVAMLQSLDRGGVVDSQIRNYGQIIVDECHHISAFSFERVMMEAKAKYVTGLTATPYRRDGHQPIITMQCGPVRYKISGKNISDSAVTHRLVIRPSDFSCSWSDGDKIHALWPFLITAEDRNQMIFDDIMIALEEKRSPIVLTERKEHLELLKQKLEKFVKHIIVLHGGMRAKTRKEMIAKLTELPDTEERLLLATGQYIGEGFDDPRLDTLFLAMPFSFKGKMVQYAGRLHRLYQGQSEVRIYDYVDINIPVLVKMHKKRLKAYKTLGYEEAKAF